MTEPAAARSLFHELVDAFARCLPRESVQALANFKVSDAVLARLDTLAAKANEGRLSAEEDADYRAFIELAEILAIIRLRARAGVSG